VALLAVAATVILHSPRLGTTTFGDNLSNQAGATNLEALSGVLFTNLLLPFEVTSVLILIAILGSVALARFGDGEKGTGE
jgi:NADH-quinone oxidoreductase subunit J